MAVTKIWTIHEGSDIKQVLDYAADEVKTVYNIKVETDETYSYSERQQFQDVLDYAMQDENIQEMENVLSYASNGDKTEERRFVSALNCSVEHARDQMMLTKTHYHKEDGILLWHGYQSFKPGEVTPEEAHRIGLLLAENLWGNDYEVLVCTHLDQEHIHNHFVINSVSWRTGRKLDVRWQDMAKESDRLCALYGKSIVDNPKTKGMHYAQWKAEQEGRPTWTSAIKQDIDETVLESRNMQEFFAGMKERGYVIKADTKYFTLKPPGKERYVRIDRRLGEAYSLFGIEERIADNVANGRVRMKMSAHGYRANGYVPRPNYKLTGYQALYIRYCYMLGTLPKRNISAGRIHYLYREELTSMHQITRETNFLCKNRIETAQDLKDAEYEIKQELNAYRKEKGYIVNRLKSASGEEKVSLEEELDRLNKQMKAKGYEAWMCRDIRERSGRLSEKAATVMKQKDEQERNRKEKVDERSDRS
ncbi:MAG: relaxase/mobilization nuclease domain-containing protein [Wujia sp.]